MKQKKIVSQDVKVSVYKPSLTDVGWHDQPAESFRVAPISMAEYIRALRQNARQGTVACKGRSEVNYSGHKLFKQKGTGRARSGPASSPLRRGGGIIHGPQPRTRELGIPQSLRRAVMRSLMYQVLQQERAYALDLGSLFNDGICTKFASYALRQAGLLGKKIVLFTRLDDVVTHASFANIPSVQLYLFDQPNGYMLAHTDYVVYLAQDRELFQNMVQQWK